MGYCSMISVYLVVVVDGKVLAYEAPPRLEVRPEVAYEVVGIELS